jgi:hypothetical protein
MRIIFTAIILGLYGPLLLSCGSPPAPPVRVNFTKADSLTEHYLSLHDSIHRVWNVMINDDNQKIAAMENLLHELIVSHPEEKDRLKSMHERLDQLMRIRYTQKSMANLDVVNEYDYASSLLVNELLANTESMKEYSYNTTLQKLTQDIRNSSQRINQYRFEYDSIVRGYNNFIELHKEALLQTDETLSLEKKPMFKMVAEE